MKISYSCPEPNCDFKSNYRKGLAGHMRLLHNSSSKTVIAESSERENNLVTIESEEQIKQLVRKAIEEADRNPTISEVINKVKGGKIID